MVFTGINKGYNIASGIQYSATVGAALEAANQKIHTIAFSENHIGTHEVTDKYLEQLAAELIDKPLGDNEIWNVNFPGCALKDCRGILTDRRVSRLAYFEDHYNVLKEFPDGGMELMVEGEHKPALDEGSDYTAVLENYVSVGSVINFC